MSSNVRVRFAPSPTGYLHIGGARTALYNWLWARKLGGKFILRVEDTDEARNTPESRAAIFDSMRWLGLDWDEGPEAGGDVGPYYQSERTAIYAEYAEKLIASGHAYRCYATKEELAAARAAHEATGTKDGFRFESPWRDRTDKPAGDATYVVRFKTPRDGVTGWDDLIKGRIEFAHSTLQDFVLIRQNNLPLYNFACVVDDMTMGITLVARADDHIINTTPQILLYKAFGVEVPQLAHMPLILAQDGTKLSKRHAAVSVTEYRDLGYLPDAMLNYLSRLGWSHGDKEIFSRKELIELFDWAAVGKQGAKYDMKKFEFVQAEHLRTLPDAEVAAGTVPFLAQRGVNVPATDRRLVQAVPFIKPRATTFANVADGVDYFLRAEPVFDDAAKKKFLVKDAAPRLRELATLVETAPAFEALPLEAAMKAWLDGAGIPMKDVAQPARVAMTGRTASPGLFDVMMVLGKETTLARLRAAATMADQA